MSFDGASSSLALIGFVWFVAAVVPGPEVLAIVHTTATGGRSRGMAMAAGIVGGTVLWGIAGYSGIAVWPGHQPRQS